MKILPETRHTGRSGAAAVELALMLPMLLFVSMATADYARLFHTLAALSDRARAGAMYASANSSASLLNINLVVKADVDAIGADLGSEVQLGINLGGNTTVKVTATYLFHTLGVYPGIPSSVLLKRTVVMMSNPS